MKAYILNKYGSSQNLEFVDIPKPKPKDNQVLIKIHATAINDYDWSMVRGLPKMYRLLFGLFKPKHQIPGMELSGIIENIGSNVTKFKIGDSVYGDISEHGFGTFAEFICIHENAVVSKPEDMSFEDAASISHASMLAVQGLIDYGKIKDNQKILINGAGGGFGTYCFQIAKLFNAEVTGVDTGKKLEKMSSMGFDKVIDYKAKDFTKDGNKYDLILDAKTNRSPWSYLNVLNAYGKYVTVGGSLTKLLQVFLFQWAILKLTKKTVTIVPLKANKDLAYIQKLYKNGQIKPVLDGPYMFKDIPWAIIYFGEGKHTGKVIISIN